MKNKHIIGKYTLKMSQVNIRCFRTDFILNKRVKFSVECIVSSSDANKILITLNQVIFEYLFLNSEDSYDDITMYNFVCRSFSCPVYYYIKKKETKINGNTH